MRQAIQQKLDELGIPAHVCGLRAVPSSVELNVLVGNDGQKIVARSGVTRSELNEHPRQLENWWVNRQGQVDLQEAIAAKEIPISCPGYEPEL